MITPIRGRKRLCYTISIVLLMRLEMITPIRGRKLYFISSKLSGTTIRNDNPDKGTETSFLFVVFITKFSIRNDNPDKGTETV